MTVSLAGRLAEIAGHRSPRRMQALLAEYAWEWKAALAAVQRFIVSWLGDAGAILSPARCLFCAA